MIKDRADHDRFRSQQWYTRSCRPGWLAPSGHGRSKQKPCDKWFPSDEDAQGDQHKGHVYTEGWQQHGTGALICEQGMLACEEDQESYFSKVRLEALKLADDSEGRGWQGHTYAVKRGEPTSETTILSPGHCLAELLTLISSLVYLYIAGCILQWQI